MKQFFLDGASNTPLDHRVLRAMLPYMREGFVGNSSSVHDFGINALNAVNTAREQVAQCVGTTSENVFFTSGATESNNWVIMSLALRELTAGSARRHIVCSSIEHSSVLRPCQALTALGFNVTFVDPSPSSGQIRSEDIRAALRSDTFLVCVMAVNNETGVANPINEISEVLQHKTTFFLVDCTQLMGCGGPYVNLHKWYPYVDYFTFSAHKFYGPTGVGCLITGNHEAASALPPLIRGGDQEHALRGGTTNTAGIVGLAKALQLAASDNRGEGYRAHNADLFTYLVSMLKLEGITFKINAISTYRNIVSLNFSSEISVPNLAAQYAARGVAVSAGSACDSAHSDIGEFNPSHVLKALGLKERDIRNTVRVSFTKYTTKSDIDAFVKATKEIIKEENTHYDDRN